MRGVLKQIREAETAVAQEIAGGELLAHEHALGYRDALMDVEAAMRGHPNAASRYWPKPQGKQVHG